jgi:glycosyltransferase involved in cell wall biosynthesis
MCRSQEAVFLIAGAGPLMPELQDYILTHNLHDKVRLLGYVTCMEDLYSICDLVALCSDSEAQPFLLLEAMRAARPAIATDVPGNRELLQGGRGVLTGTTPQAIALGVDSLLTDRQRAAEFAANGHGWFLENHLLDKQVSELTDTYVNYLLNIEEEYAGRPIAAN